MATTEMTSWAVDLATVGPIYPFVGTEMLWVVLATVFWIGWHVWQLRAENRTLVEDMERLRTPDDIEAALAGDRLRAVAVDPSMGGNRGAAGRQERPVGAAR